jgi:serine/threonine protein kinase
MNKYRITKQLGDGSFGTVIKAQDVETGEMVLRLVDSGRYKEDEKEVLFME